MIKNMIEYFLMKSRAVNLVCKEHKKQLPRNHSHMEFFGNLRFRPVLLGAIL